MAGSTLLKTSFLTTVTLAGCWVGYQEPKPPSATEVLTKVTSPQKKKPLHTRPIECQEAFVRLYSFEQEEADCDWLGEDYWVCMFSNRQVNWYKLNWLVGQALDACAPEVYARDK